MGILQGIHILVVEVNSQQLEDRTSILASEGATVTRTVNVDSLRSLLTTNSFDFILGESENSLVTNQEIMAIVNSLEEKKPKTVFIAKYEVKTLTKLYLLGADGVFPQGISAIEIVAALFRLRPTSPIESTRSAPRHPYQYDVEVTATKKTRVISGKLTDIGLGGMRLNLVDFVPELGEKIHFRWSGLDKTEPNRAIVGSGICRWIRLADEGFFSVGIEFTEPSLGAMYEVLDKIKECQLN